jgi:thiol reductant ABC exporter CydC subunit
MTDIVVFKRLVGFFRPLAGWVALAVGLGLLTIVSGIGLMTTSAFLISEAALHPSISALSVAIVGVRFFGLARGVFRYLERYVSHQVTFKLLARFRVWFYEKLEPLAPAVLVGNQYRSGDLLGRVVADVETLQNFYVRVIAPPLVAALLGLGLWFFLGGWGFQLAFIFLGFYLLAGVGVPLLSYWLGREIGQSLIATRAELNALLIDSVQGLADLLAFGQAERQQAKIAELDQKLARLQKRQNWLAGLQTTLSNALMNLAAFAMLLAATGEVEAGRLDPVWLAALVLAALAGFEGVLPLPMAFQQLGQALAAGRRLFELAGKTPAVTFSAEPGPQPQDYSLTFDWVCFRYEAAGPLVLDNLSFKLAAGQTLALIGPSGAGKSTLGNLVLRFWDCESGQIRLGGQDIRTYSQEQLYALFSVVSQDTHLFNTTIRQNIALARPGATLDEVEQAARQAQLHDLIMSLPEGYDTLIGEQGLRLSGGQRQRLSIARAALKNAPVLVLDEPTANLDPDTEREVLSALQTLRHGRTTLLITHRLAALEGADQIMELQPAF